MKRFLSIFLVAVLVVTCMSTAAFAAGSATATVSSSQNVEAGQEVTLTVSVGNCFSNYEMTVSATDGLLIKSISGVTNNIKDGGKSAKVAYATSDNVDNHSFKVTVLVPSDAENGDTFQLKADVTLAYMKVDPAEDTNDGYVDGRVEVSMTDGSATLTVVCDHTWGAWTVTKAPSCTEKGVETRECSKCGETETRPVDTVDHSWSAWTQTKAPTCSVKGEETRTCSVCGETETRPVDTVDHSWGEWVVTKPATCTEDGLKTRTCSVCGEKQTEVIPSSEGHAWGEWVVTKAADCVNDGEQTRTCSACGETETEIIPATGHVWGTEWEMDETHHWHECSVCGEKCEHNGEHEPTDEWEIVKEPTRTETGLKQKTCKTCGCVIDTEEIPCVKDPTPGPVTGDPTMALMIGGLFILLLLLAVALYYIKRKASAK